jgi:hypothetical protein
MAKAHKHSEREKKKGEAGKVSDDGLMLPAIPF